MSANSRCLAVAALLAGPFGWGAAWAQEPFFRRGDVNQDRTFEVPDAIEALLALFQAGQGAFISVLIGALQAGLAEMAETLQQGVIGLRLCPPPSS